MKNYEMTICKLQSVDSYFCPLVIAQGTRVYDYGGNKGIAYTAGCKTQSGVVLVISLIMLLLLTIIGVASIQTTTLEEKMTGNTLDKNIAFQAAESSLKAAEASLSGPGALPVFVDVGTGGFYSENSTIPTDTAILEDDFWEDNPVAQSTVTTLGNGIDTPQYIIQSLPVVCLGFCPPDPLKTPYRVTVRATGRSDNTVVILQSIYMPS